MGHELQLPLTVLSLHGKNHLRKQEFLLTCSLRMPSVMAGSSQWRDCEAAGHIASTLRKPINERWCPEAHSFSFSPLLTQFQKLPYRHSSRSVSRVNLRSCRGDSQYELLEQQVHFVANGSQSHRRLQNYPLISLLQPVFHLYLLW